VESAILDTSFLLTLLDARAEHHTQAQGYFSYLAEQHVRLYLSTISAAEVSEGVVLEKLPLFPHLRLLAFNLPDAELAAQYVRQLEAAVSKKTLPPNYADACKVLAQTTNAAPDAYLTADRALVQQVLTPLLGAKPAFRVLAADVPHEAAFGLTGKLFE